MVKVVADVTEQAKQISQKIFNFPKEVKVLEATVILNSWREYKLIVKYEMDEIIRSEEMYVTTSLEGALYSILEKIKDYYQRMHEIQI